MFMLNKLFESESESVQYAVGYQHSHILSLLQPCYPGALL